MNLSVQTSSITIGTPLNRLSLFSTTTDVDLAYFNVAKFNITKKYKSEQKFFSQWVMKTSSSLNITHQTPSETRPELSIQELRRMTDDIAANIQQTMNLPEGLHDALNMVLAH
jgi:hypothetical protein